MHKLYSFDIFDTCLVRSCGAPENIFYILGYEIMGKSCSECLLRDFVRERSKAEQTAKNMLQKEAVSLDELYSFFNTKIYTDKNKDIIKEKEIELEKQLLVPVQEIKCRVDTCRSNGKIAFISDMYLPDEIIKSVLVKYGLFREGDSLYISASSKCTKRTGNLYRLVKEKENIKYRNWRHYGDNLFSDYLIPLKFGIKAKRVQHKYSTYEFMWQKSSIFSQEKWIHSVFAGLTRSIRLKHGAGKKDDFIINVMFPALVPFVYALLRKAESDQIKRLYFASRDTYIFFLMAQQVHHLFPNIELRYLYISTKILYSASVMKGDRDELIDIMKLLKRFKPMQFLLMLGFEQKDIELLVDIDLENECSSETSGKLLDLITQGSNRDKLLQVTKKKRSILLDYLRQEGFLSNDRVALFDVGWRCTSQMMLNKIISITPVYYYYGVYKSRKPVEKTGEFYSFSYFEDYDKLDAAKFIEFYMCKMLEGTTTGYYYDGVNICPQIKDKSFSIDEIKDFDRRIQLMIDGMKLYSEFPFFIENAKKIMDIISMPTLYQTAKFPSRNLTRFLSKKMFWDHYVDYRPMIVKLNPLVLWEVIYHTVRKTHKYDGLWLNASIILTFGGFGKLFIKFNFAKKAKKIGRIIYEMIR